MGTGYSEVVVEGPFPLVKGFLVGFRAGRGEPFGYFFHRKTGIRRETLRDVLVELFDLENLVHLCVASDAVAAFTGAVEEAGGKIGLKVRSIRPIRGASFSFTYQVYSQELAGACRFLTADLPAGVRLEGFAPLPRVPDADALLIVGYSGEHPYYEAGRGTIKGDFAGVIDLFLRCKRDQAVEFVMTGEVALELEEVGVAA